jgi:hypothetical protein
MSDTQIRLAIMNYQSPAIDLDMRATRMIEAVKAETRWQLLTAPRRSFALDEQHYTKDRAALVAAWPRIRHRRMPDEDRRAFYQRVADHASILAHVIEVRRQRQQQKASQCGERRDDQDQ